MGQNGRHPLSRPLVSQPFKDQALSGAEPPLSQCLTSLRESHAASGRGQMSVARYGNPITGGCTGQ
jgi:hypothetical protein